jgi:hypothetical protein
MLLAHAVRSLTENTSGSVVPLFSTRNVDRLTINPLTGDHRRGLIAISAIALCSFLTTGTLIAFITYRLIFWRRYYKSYIGYNQFVILIYNLLLADFQQALGFLLSMQWLVQNSIHAPSVVCFLQGWWLQVGDPASGLFVLAIAVHTFATVWLGRKLPHRWFTACVIGLWMFVGALAVIPTILHGIHTYVPAGAWVRLLLPPLNFFFMETRTDPGTVLDR